MFNGITQHNRNRLLWDQSLQVDGIKTGHVSQVGYNLVSSATNNEGMRLIAVVWAPAAKPPAPPRAKAAHLRLPLLPEPDPGTGGHRSWSQKIWMGDKPGSETGVDKDVSVLVTRGQGNNLKADFQLESELKAPLAKNRSARRHRVPQTGDRRSKQVPLVALEEVQEGGLMSRLWDYLVMLVSSWFK